MPERLVCVQGTPESCSLHAGHFQSGPSTWPGPWGGHGALWSCLDVNELAQESSDGSALARPWGRRRLCSRQVAERENEAFCWLKRLCFQATGNRAPTSLKHQEMVLAPVTTKYVHGLASDAI